MQPSPSTAYPFVPANCRENPEACTTDGKLAFVSIFGRIGREDLEFFRRIDRALPVGAPFPRVLVNSSGGDVDTAFEIGRILRKRGATIETGSPVIEDYRPQCSSACVLIAAGAVQRRLTHIGIHSSHLRVKSLDGTIKDVQGDPTRIAAYLTEMGIPPEVSEILTDTPFDDMADFFLDPAQPLAAQDIVRFGFFMPDVQPFDPAWANAKPVADFPDQYNELVLAHEAGAVTAATDLAHLVTSDRVGETANFTVGNDWLRKGASRGDVVAMHELAYHYEYGIGADADQGKAIALYKQAAALGFAGSQNNLGWAYYTGKGVPQSLQDAVYWLTRSAEQGEPFAYGSLCEIQAATDFLRDNRAEAYKWCQLALRDLPDGNAEDAAKAALAKLEGVIADADRAAGEALVKTWKPLRQAEITMQNVGDDLN